jgi:hypothetical protein
MGNPTHRNGPPKFIADLVETLTPRASRQAVTFKLFRNYRNFLSYAFNAVLSVGDATATQSIAAFDTRRLLGDLCCILIGFAAAPLAPMGAILAVAIPVLLWRDGFIHPPEPSAPEAAIDTLIVATAIVMSQALFLWAGQPWAVPWQSLGPDLAISMGVFSGWRFAVRREEPPRNPGDEFYKDAWRVNTLWFLATVGLIWANKTIAPPESARDFLTVVLPVTIWVIDYRKHNPTIGAPRDRKLQSAFADPRELEQIEKLNRLLRSMSFEWMFFLSLAFPILMVLVEVWIGRMAATAVNWMQLYANTGAVLMLWKVWTEVEKVNLQAIRTLEQEIERRKAATRA